MQAKLTRLNPGIYYISTTNYHVLSMLFWRVQESFDGKFAGHFGEEVPTLVDFMDFYVKETGSAFFSYPNDFEGYNVNRSHLEALYEAGASISDWNKYDDYMSLTMRQCNADCGSEPYCLIGTVRGDRDVLYHELAHAFYSLDTSYRQSQDSLMRDMGAAASRKARKSLMDMGYSRHVVKDELQAYASTGGGGQVGMSQQQCRPFAKAFRKRLRLTGLDRVK